MIELPASAPILPISKDFITYNPIDRSYKVTGSYNTIRPVDTEMFYANPAYIIFIVLLQYDDEPQIQLQVPSASGNTFYTRADIEDSNHTVLFAYSNGVLGSQTKPLWLTPVTEVVYKYMNAITIFPISKYRYSSPFMQENAILKPLQDKLVFNVQSLLDNP